MAKTSMEMLGSAGLFEGLSKKELAMIHKQAREGEFPAGEVVVTEGRVRRRLPSDPQRQGPRDHREADRRHARAG